MAICEEYKKQYGIRDIMLMLSKYKVTPDKCLNIYRRFGEKSTEIIKQNPYILCDEGLDFRFETAEDKICLTDIPVYRGTSLCL